MSIKTYKQATWEAMKEEMLRDPSVYAMAEDIIGNGGSMGHYIGLGEAVGDQSRVLDAPISETAIVASAVGAALAGMRPVIDMRFSNCLPVCMDELTNQAAKSRYMFGGQGKVHMVVRCPDGILKMQGAHHTDCLEAWFAHMPGLQVVIPSSPAEGKGLLKTAIRNDNPVMFFEHKALYSSKCDVPDDPEFMLPFGKADIKRAGTDVTIVANLLYVSRALEAAEELQKQGVSAEVIDPMTLVPFDKETVINSVKKTGRLVVVHEAHRTAGWGAEVAAMVTEEAFRYLDAAPVRLGTKACPLPFNVELENAATPQIADIVAAARSVCYR